MIVMLLTIISVIVYTILGVAISFCFFDEITDGMYSSDKDDFPLAACGICWPIFVICYIGYKLGIFIRKLL